MTYDTLELPVTRIKTFPGPKDINPGFFYETDQTRAFVPAAEYRLNIKKKIISKQRRYATPKRNDYVNIAKQCMGIIGMGFIGTKVPIKRCRVVKVHPCPDHEESYHSPSCEFC